MDLKNNQSQESSPPSVPDLDALVNTLRGMALGPSQWNAETWQFYANQAAAEIERLTRERDQLAKAMDKTYAMENYNLRLEVERLRAALEQIAQRHHAEPFDWQARLAREALRREADQVSPGLRGAGEI